MKKTFALPLIAASLFAALFAFAGCANMEDGAQFALAKAPSAGTDGGSQIADGSGGQGGGGQSAGGQSGSQEPVMVTVSGSLAFGGAFPEQIAALVDNSLAASQSAGQGGEGGLAIGGLDGVARSAFPKTPDASGLTYTVYALEELPAGSTDTPLRYEGTVAADGKSYTVGIPVTEGKKYYVYANAANSDGFVLLSGKSAVLDFTTITSFKTDVNIALGAAQTATGKGFVELEADVAGTEIHHGRISYTPAGGITNFFLANKTGSKVKFKIGSIEGGVFVDAVQSGAYTMTFDFFTEGNELLYSFKENVSVFDNLVTNTWVQNGAEPWFVTTASAGVKTTTCKVTAAMVQGYALTDIYVNTDLSVGDDAGSGSFMHPKATFAVAVGMLVNENADYTIHIKDTVEGGQTIPSTIRAKSLTLCGETPIPTTGSDAGVPQDKIDAQAVGGKSALLIETTVPITIKNLKITGGRGTPDGGNAYGGGICLKAEGGSLTLASGAYVSENQAKDGAGICLYPACSLNILDGAVIEKNESARQGGGIFCKSTSAAKKDVITMSGGHIRGNKAVYYGGALNMQFGTFTMTGGVIGDDTERSQAAKYGDDARLSAYSNTAAEQGGAIYSSDGNFDIYLLGGTIAYNCARNSGGAIYLYSGNMTVKNAKIQYNGAGGTFGGSGGAFCFSQYANLHLEDCSIIGNECYGEWGGAIYVPGALNTDATPNIYLKGSVSIPSDGALKNDIVLKKHSNTSAAHYEYPALTIKGKLTGSGKIARLTPTTDDYDENRVVLKLADGVTDTSLAQVTGLFDVTPNGSETWAVGTDGKLVKSYELTSANIETLTLESGREYYFVIGPDVNDAQFKTFTGKLLSNTKIDANSTLDLSKATQLTGMEWETTSSGSFLQKFDTVIIGPNFTTTSATTTLWCSSSNVHYLFLYVKNIVAPSNCVNFVSKNGILFSKDKTKLVFYPGGGVREETEYTIPSTVTEIAQSAFYWASANSTGLRSITIPFSVKKLGKEVFPNVNTFPTSGTLTFIDASGGTSGTSGWHQNNMSGAVVAPSNLTAANYKTALSGYVLVRE